MITSIPRSRSLTLTSLLLLLGVVAAGCEQRKAIVKTKQIALAPTRNETSPFEAAIRFLESIDGEAIICSPEALVDAVDGQAGTHIRRT